MSDRRFAARVAEIEPFRVMAVLEQARALEQAGRDIIHMEVGEPDFPTAAPIVEAGRAALAAGRTQYSPALGLPELRAAISDHYRRTQGLDIDPRRILITAGASGALLLAAALLVEPGSGVLLADPGYPCNRHFIRLFGGEPQAVAVAAAQRFQLLPALAQQQWRPNSRGLLLATPSNPTGTVLNRSDLRGFAELAVQREAFVLVDEIYQGLTYGSDAPSMLAFTDEAYVINSFSKYFGMTGWRLGWLVAPPTAVAPLEKLAQNLFIAPSTPAQHAALAAFSASTIELLEAQRGEFQRRRDLLLPALRQAGLVIEREPEGAFYLYAAIDHLGLDSETFCLRLLEEEGVAITPGTDFGQYRANDFVRVAYTADIDRLAQAAARIARFVARLG